ncbi:2506_t:CDS:2 [Dentiscutata erythropus]|uniref:2506_t:CDS:1 n=1 Tax=Dentiscutata erythropus TaxID=1348616 RepID=A0A9N9B8G1_9GLOM|nr:2506_t:CDS:2 [Dentiscutata erythropus]
MFYLDNLIKRLGELCQEIVSEYEQEQNQDGSYDVCKNLSLVELCQEIVRHAEMCQDSNDGVPKENFSSMLYDNEVPLNLLCDVSGFTPILQSAFTANQLNDSPTTSTDIALSDNMFNSSYLEFEENQFAPIMRGQKTNSLRFIPYDVNPANRSDRKASKIIGEMWSNELSEECLNFENKAKELKHEHTIKYPQQKPKGK